VNDWRYSEVGNVFLVASSSDYLGDSAADITGNSGLDGTGVLGGYVGRFRPKHFAVSAAALTNRLTLGCGGAWSYMGENLQLQFTLTAQNAQNARTRNYNAGYAKLALGTFANFGLGARSGTTNLTPRVDTGVAPAGNWVEGEAIVTMTTRINRATPNNPDGPYAVQFGIAPSDGDTPAVTMNTLDFDADNNGVNERKNLGVATEVRFGRLRIENAVGSERLPLPIRMETQYWTGAATGFARNDDSCTPVVRENFSLGSCTGNLAACETALSAAGATFSSGAATLNLAAPGAGNDGTVLVTLNAGTASGNRCDAVGGAGPAATSANLPYLLGRWTSGTYDDNPSARAAFGLYGSQPNNFIYFRENF